MTRQFFDSYATDPLLYLMLRRSPFFDFTCKSKW